MNFADFTSTETTIEVILKELKTNGDRSRDGTVGIALSQRTTSAGSDPDNEFQYEFNLELQSFRPECQFVKNCAYL